MPAASPLEAIVTSVAEALEDTTGIESVTIAPVAEFNVDEDGTVTLKNVTFPKPNPTTGKAYPGAVISVNEHRIPITQKPRTVSPFRNESLFRATVSIAIYATSDGALTTTAQFKAWEVGSAVFIKFNGFMPTGIPEPYRTQADEPMEAFEEVPIVIDGHTHGVMYLFYAKYHHVPA